MQAWTPDQLKSHLDAGDRVFLKLWKKGCGACKLAIPATDRLEASNKHKLTFGQICTDDHPEILEIADADALPLFFVFSEQKMLGKYIGFKGLQKLEEFIDNSFMS